MTSWNDYFSYLAANLLLTFLSTLIVSIIFLILGIYGRRIIFYLERAIYFAFDFRFEIESFQMTIASQIDDISIRDRLVRELADKLHAREIKSNGGPKNVVTLDIESNNNVFDVLVAANENVVPELEDNVINISITVKLRNKNLHYRAAFQELEATMNNVKQYVHGVLGNELNFLYHSSSLYPDRSRNLTGSTKGVKVTIDNGILSLDGELKPVVSLLKLTLISLKMALYDMIRI